VEPVQPAGALGPVADETGLLQQPQVPRDGGPADRQLVGQLAYGAVALPQQLDDRAAVGVAQCVEGVSGKGAERDDAMVAELLRSLFCYRTGEDSAMEYRASSSIEADPDTIWAILIDAGAYPDWDNGVVRIDGDIAPGERVKLYSELDPKRGHAIKVVRFEPGRGMTWKGGMPLGLFTGIRTLELAPEGDGVTRFTMEERFSGPLLPLIGRSLPDLGPSFEKFATGLKRRAEGAA
jgi:hypothetical protein